MEEHKVPEEEYSFLKETIKDEALKTKLKRDVLRMSWLGLIFGVIASFSFSAFHPLMDKLFKSDPQEVTIPEEKEEEDGKEEEKPEETEQQILDAQSYRQIQKSLTEIAVQAKKSVVEITGAKSTEDWTAAAEEAEHSAAGLIIADNGQQLLILGEKLSAEEAGEVQVIFGDGQAYPARLKKQDGNLGLGIYAVERSAIADATWAQIETAKLGSSKSVVEGDPVIVLGNPFGSGTAMGFGTIASTQKYQRMADGNYQFLCTDIAAAENGSGVLVNLAGEVVGIVAKSTLAEEEPALVTGYGITELKKVIELLSNGQSVPYLGISGVDVTAQVVEQGIPEGVYVKEVAADSPAMSVGIQTGDVIISIGGEKVITFAAYHQELFEKRSGEKIKLKVKRQGSGGYVDVEFDVTVGSKE